MTRPLSSFTVTELDALPVGYRFVDPSDGDVLTKEADGWKRSGGAYAGVALDSESVSVALGAYYQTITPEPPPVAVTRVDLEHRWTDPEAPPLTLTMEYEQADWTPPRPTPIEYDSVTPWTVTGLLDFPAVAPQGGPDVVIPPRKEYLPGPWRATHINPWPDLVRFEGDTYRPTDCPTCKAPIFMLAGTGVPTTGGLDARSGVIARDTDWSPHTCATSPQVPPYVPLPPITIDTTGPTCVRRVTGAPMGLPPRTLASGEANRYTREMAEARAARYRLDGYTDVTVSVYRPDPKAPAEECPACGEYGWHDSRCDLDSYHLRAYLRTNADPTSTADQVAAALDLLTEEDRALGAPYSRLPLKIARMVVSNMVGIANLTAKHLSSAVWDAQRRAGVSLSLPVTVDDVRRWVDPKDFPRRKGVGRRTFNQFVALMAGEITE